MSYKVDISNSFKDEYRKWAREYRRAINIEETYDKSWVEDFYYNYWEKQDGDPIGADEFVECWEGDNEN